MIKLLGFRRTLLLGIMLGLNGLFAAVYFLWAGPQTAALNAELNGLRAEISGLQTNIQNTKTDMKMLEENIITYEEYVRRGFFQEQDRFVMSRALDEVKVKSRIQGFSFSVGDINEIQNADAKLADRRLLHSRITINRISSVLDINFFDMLGVIEKDFPMYARIHSFELTRNTDLTEELLSQVGDESFSLITASIVFDWLSLGAPQQPAGTAPITPGGF